MQNYQESIKTFFDSFEMETDKKQGHFFKGYLTSVILDFIKNENKDNAFLVYSTFFDCYRLKLHGQKSFIDLLDTLKAYEENASILLDKQRDHYVHSVNVFILGIYIYVNNHKYKNIFHDYYNKDKYTGSFESAEEEFIFRWGIAALFHDIGYPVEITNNQLKKFMKFVVEKDGKEDAKPYIGYWNFDQMNQIQKSTKLNYTLATDNQETVNTSDSLELLSYSMHKAFQLDFHLVKTVLGNFLGVMQKQGFVDHGYYSAIIVLGWYGYLVEKSGLNPEVLYHPILDAASSILLHNFYKNVLQKEPFSLKQMKADSHPIAYLLILCDELQEWNREAYGVLDRQRVLAADSEITVTDESLTVHFITYEKTLSEDFAPSKEKMFEALLDLKEIFSQSIRITSTTKSELYVKSIRKKESFLLPRPFLENIEDLAKIIHERYNEEQKKRNPDTPLEYPDWNSLPDTLKYSNISQARGFFDKLKLMGWVALPEQSHGEEIKGFTKEQIEELALEEHERWYEERKQNGWIYGPEKNVEEKKSPFMVPFEQLPENIKELDRDAVRNIFPLLNSIGLKVYKI